MNYYELLKVSPSASVEEIKKAYILLSKMMHPDKFDSINQRDQWEKANEFLKDLNEAFSVLKDQKLRRDYDLSIGVKSSDKINNKSGSNSSKIVKSGEAWIDNLPVEIVSKLNDLSRNKLSNSINLVVSGVRRSVWGLVVSTLFTLGIFGSTYSKQWENGELLIALLFVTIALTCIAYFILAINVYTKRKVNSGVFMTSLHLIVIKGHYCKYYWRRDMKDIKVIHNHRNGIYTGTDITFVFESGSVDVKFSSKKNTEDLANYMERTDRYINRMVENEDWIALHKENIFAGAEELTPQHLKFKNPTHHYSYWKIAFPIVLLVASLVYVINFYLSDVYLWDEANSMHSIDSYKSYLSESRRQFFLNQAEDSCWNVARQDGSISALRDYMSGSMAMKYSDEAIELIRLKYKKIKVDYKNQNNDSKDPRFVAVVCDWLDRAMNEGKTTINVVFVSENKIPENYDKVIMRRTNLQNILPIGDAFSNEKNASRNSDVFNKFSDAFASVIPTDALVLQMVDTSKVSESDVFIAYTVSPGKSLYYRDEDSTTAEENRPFYPGVIYSWQCFVIGENRDNPFVLRFVSKPADNFRLTDGGVYNDMANSAFIDLESELTSLLKRNNRNEKSNIYL